MTNYVLGFMFSADFERVALIRKNKPVWQAGKLNGIGGKVEAGEDDFQAMVREFEEETGHKTSPSEWVPYAVLLGGDFRVTCFAAVGNLSQLKSMEEEPVEDYASNAIYPTRPDVIENLPWLVAMAIDRMIDGRPAFCSVTYPAQ